MVGSARTKFKRHVAADQLQIMFRNKTSARRRKLFLATVKHALPLEREPNGTGALIQNGLSTFGYCLFIPEKTVEGVQLKLLLEGAVYSALSQCAIKILF
jgi:hypothetical protein